MQPTGQETGTVLQADIPPAALTLEETTALLAACVAVFGRWGLNPEMARTLLGSPSESTFEEWTRGQTSGMPEGTIRRLGHVLAIHEALRPLSVDPVRACAWIRRSNGGFGGRSALEVMLAGSEESLLSVRHYLEAEGAG